MRNVFAITWAFSLMGGILGYEEATDGPAKKDNAASTAAKDVNVETAKSGTLSPEQTLARLIELARAGDWETYVDDFYGESHKLGACPSAAMRGSPDFAISGRTKSWQVSYPGKARSRRLSKTEKRQSSKLMASPCSGFILAMTANGPSTCKRTGRPAGRAIALATIHLHLV